MPSLTCLPTPISAPRSHRFWCPVEHDGQRPHEGMKPNTTWSPGFSQLTFSPTSSTTPAPSWPPIIGSSNGRSPVTRCSSEWHIPDAAILTSTSPAFGAIELDLLDAPRRVRSPTGSRPSSSQLVPPWYCSIRRTGRMYPCGVRAVSTGSISADQSTSSVDPPSARTAARRAARSPARATTSSVSRAPAWSRSRRASAGLAPPVLTAIDSGPLRAIAGRMNEQSAGWSAALTQMPAAVASAATAASTAGVAGGGDDEAHAVEVAGLVAPLVQLGDGSTGRAPLTPTWRRPGRWRRRPRGRRPCGRRPARRRRRAPARRGGRATRGSRTISRRNPHKVDEVTRDLIDWGQCSRTRIPWRCSVGRVRSSVTVWS